MLILASESMFAKLRGVVYVSTLSMTAKDLLHTINFIYYNERQINMCVLEDCQHQSAGQTENCKDLADAGLTILMCRHSLQPNCWTFCISNLLKVSTHSLSTHK